MEDDYFTKKKLKKAASYLLETASAELFNRGPKHKWQAHWVPCLGKRYVSLESEVFYALEEDAIDAAERFKIKCFEYLCQAWQTTGEQSGEGDDG